jgi:Zn-dependent peptidase ImmA (M78 family)
LRRGFKSTAERLAEDIRARQGVGDVDPVVLERVAADMGVDIVAADELVERSRLEELAAIQSDAFSAATFERANGRKAIVYNPLHSQGRNRSNQAHELAHILLDHEVRTIERVGSFIYFTCDSEQEEEADWLGGCLLLPRALLLKAAFAGLGSVEIAEKFGTSEPMARFRLNASGVLVQVGRARAKKTPS